ncbi:MAG: exonuclease SbcCD subunit D C-terminal domain-containing protein [Tannerella sp.]|jgi:exonuclease SbcD|nr:exonuclease SbcCD subunit D C-terminal domain-containing protein [Tannerella sp.]
MIKLLHTADWHLGQTFFEYDRKGEHAQFLQWLREQIRIHEADVLLIAGDVFDSSNPSAESQRVFYTFIKDITAENPNLQVIIIAGNHDSAARLEAPNPLLEAMNVTVRGIVKRTDDGEIDFEHLRIPLNKGGTCLAVPYLRQGDYPESATYSEGVQAMYKILFERIEDKSQPIIAMGHLQATGSEISQNDRAERTIIGGLECISPEAFADSLSYVALGHLHRAQRVSGRENVRYAGAPLPMSFAEKNNKQGVTFVKITDKTEIERLEFDPPVKLISLPKEPLPLSETLAELEKLPDGEINATSPFLEIKVRITEPEPSLRNQIEKALEGKAVRLARVEAIMVQNEGRERIISYEELQKINPLDMATDIFKRKYGGDDLPENLKGLLQSVIREIN